MVEKNPREETKMKQASLINKPTGCQHIRLTLPFPPTVNSYWRSIPMGKHVRVLVSKKGREYQKDVAALCHASRVAGLDMPGRLAVGVTLYPPDRRKRDIDNYNKALLDSLTKAVVWQDDEQIDELRIVRGEPCRGGNVVVDIRDATAIQVMQKIVERVAIARVKHPIFTPQTGSPLEAVSIITEEVGEMAQAVNDGDIAHAKDEALDAIATLVRFIEEVGR